MCKHYVALLPRILTFHTCLGSQSGCFNPKRLPSVRVSLGSDGEKCSFARNTSQSPYCLGEVIGSLLQAGEAVSSRLSEPCALRVH